MTEPGERVEITTDEAASLPNTDPNIAGADHGPDGVVDHEQYLGDFVADDDPTVVEGDALAASVEPDQDGDTDTDTDTGDGDGGAQ